MSKPRDEVTWPSHTASRCTEPAQSGTTAFAVNHRAASRWNSPQSPGIRSGQSFSDSSPLLHPQGHSPRLGAAFSLVYKTATSF